MNVTVPDIKRWRAVDLWPHEATNFNPWLASNLHVLNGSLRAPWKFTTGKFQQVAGALFVDILAEMSDGRTGVIETQYGQTNHDHLGKLITYAAVYGAGAAVWIAEDPRPEHVEAVTKLNGRGLADFYLVRLEVISVGESSVKAPLLTVVTGSSAVLKTVGTEQAQTSERAAQLTAFWEGMVPLAAKVMPYYASKSQKARSSRRMSVPTGRAGIRYAVEVQRHSASCSLLILGGKFGPAVPVLGELQGSKQSIESAVGMPLQWQSGARGRLRLDAGIHAGYADPDEWAALQPALAIRLEKLRDALSPVLSTLTSRVATGTTAEEDEDEEADDGDESEEAVTESA